MAIDGAVDETKVTDCGTVSVSEDVRKRLGIEPGDTLRWAVKADGPITVTVVRQREGVFDDFEPVDVGPTDAVAIEREFGTE